MNSFRSIHLILLTLSITEVPAFAGNSISIEEAAKKGLIKITIKGKGGYLGDVIEMKIKNISSKKLDLKIEAGRILDSKNNTEQDILLTRSQKLILNPNQLQSLNLSGMCCQAHNSAPQANSDYTVGKLADTTLIKLAKYIDTNKYYSNHTAQQAVWCLSDNNSLASISDGNAEVVSDLRNYVSKITGRPIPSYNITYRQENASDLLGRATKIEGIFDYSLTANCHATLAIYDSQGHLVQLVFENIAHEKGEYNLYYTFRTRNLPKGTYYARMNTDGRLCKEMLIEF